MEIGKQWFYRELGQIAPVQTKQGWETKALRDMLGLTKSAKKMAEIFKVTVWMPGPGVERGGWIEGAGQDASRLCDAAAVVSRQLHRLKPKQGGIRPPYGGTRSLGFTRGTLVLHPRYGLVYVGGTSGGGLSLYRVADGARLCRMRTQQTAGCVLFCAGGRGSSQLPNGERVSAASSFERLAAVVTDALVYRQRH